MGPRTATIPCFRADLLPIMSPIVGARPLGTSITSRRGPPALPVALVIRILNTRQAMTTTERSATRNRIWLSSRTTVTMVLGILDTMSAPIMSKSAP